MRAATKLEYSNLREKQFEAIVASSDLAHALHAHYRDHMT